MRGIWIVFSRNLTFILQGQDGLLAMTFGVATMMFFVEIFKLPGSMQGGNRSDVRDACRLRKIPRSVPKGVSREIFSEGFFSLYLICFSRPPFCPMRGSSGGIGVGLLCDISDGSLSLIRSERWRLLPVLIGLEDSP